MQRAANVQSGPSSNRKTDEKEEAADPGSNQIITLKHFMSTRINVEPNNFFLVNTILFFCWLMADANSFSRNSVRTTLKRGCSAFLRVKHGFKLLMMDIQTNCVQVFEIQRFLWGI